MGLIGGTLRLPMTPLAKANEAVVENGLRRDESHLEVFVAEEGHVHARSARQQRGGFEQPGHVFARHLEREVFEQLGGGVGRHGDVVPSDIVVARHTTYVHRYLSSAASGEWNPGR